MLKVTDEGLLDIEKVQTTKDVGRMVASIYSFMKPIMQEIEFIL